MDEKQTPQLGRSGVSEARAVHQRRALVFAALTDQDGNAKPWLAAEEIGYSPFCKDLSLNQIVAALRWLRESGYVKHSGGCEWKLTPAGLEQTRRGL